MQIVLTSVFDVGDMVTYTYEDKHSSTGQSRDTGPVTKVEYHTRRGFIYSVQGPNGSVWGPHHEWDLKLAPAGAVAGTEED